MDRFGSWIADRAVMPTSSGLQMTVSAFEAFHQGRREAMGRVDGPDADLPLSNPYAAVGGLLEAAYEQGAAKGRAEKSSEAAAVALPSTE